MSDKDYSNSDCINSLIEASEIVDGKLTHEEYKRLDIKPSVWVIKNRFRSWNKAKEIAGLDTNTTSRLKLSDGPPDLLEVSNEEWKELNTATRNRKRKQAYVAEKKVSEGCSKCGYNEHPAALDYHHTGNKSAEVATAVASRGMEFVKEVADECIVLCSNCHRIVTDNPYDENYYE